MASFTDKSLQFNPYIQELPVQEMVQVGMQKQAQYDQGVQKIQNYIDRVGGVELYRPQDKQILQSKLNELGSKLKTVAAGDFSNQQLVNSVAGMTGQIIKDENIINAISSTQQYKKAVKEREEYLKDGKTSPSNDWLFQQKTNKWMNGDIKEKFSGGYDPYTNWRKNALGIIKELTGDSTITEDAFTTVRGKDGKPQVVLADAITRTKLAGVSPDQIKQALSVGLTPADWRQLEIDGAYTYSNITDPNVFRENVNEQYLDKTEYFTKQKQLLENSLSSTNSNVQTQIIQSKIDGLNSTIKKLDNERYDILDLVHKGELEKAKANLYTLNSINNFAKPFSHTEVEITKESSPEADMAMRRATLNQAYKFHQDAMYWKGREVAAAEDANRIAKKAAEGYGGFAAPVDQDALPKVSVRELTMQTNVELDKLETKDAAFLRSQGKSQEWLDQQRAAYEARPSGVSPVIANYFNSTQEERRRVEANQSMLVGLRAKAEAQYGKIDDLIPKNAPVINYRKGNEAYQYTAKDFVDFNSAYSRYLKVTPPAGPGGKPTTTYDFEKASKELSPKQFHLLQLKAGKVPAVGGEKVLLDNVNNYQKIVNRPYQATLENIDKTMEDEFKNRVSVTQAVGYNIPSITPAQKGSLKSFLISAAAAADKTGGKLADSPDWDSETAREIAGSENPNFSIDVVEGTEFQPSYYKVTALGSGGKKVSFRLNPEQKIGTFGTQFDDVASQQLRPYLDQINKTGGMTTAMDGSAKTTPGNAFLSNLDFGNVKTYGVKANIINLGGGNYTLGITAYDPTSAKRTWSNEMFYPSVGSMTKEGLNMALQNMTDSEIFRLINGRPATADDLQKIQKASQKPL
jgi:hypothetical protein